MQKSISAKIYYNSTHRHEAHKNVHIVRHLFILTLTFSNCEDKNSSKYKFSSHIFIISFSCILTARINALMKNGYRIMISILCIVLHVRCVLFTIKLLHKCFELLCSLLMPLGWVYVFYKGYIDKIIK
jgi:hypothetical protein